MQDALSSASNWGEYVRATVKEKQSTPWDKAGLRPEPVSRPHPKPGANPILQSMDASTTRAFTEKQNVDANRGWNKSLEQGRGQRFDILSQEERVAVRTPRRSQAPNPPARDLAAETFAKQKAYLHNSAQSTRVDYNVLTTKHFTEQHWLAPELRPEILRGAEREEKAERARAARASTLLNAGSRADFDIITGELHGDGAAKTAAERKAAFDRAVALRNKAATESVHPILQTFGEEAAEQRQREADAAEWETLRRNKAKQQPPRYRIREGAGMDLTSGIVRDETILAQAESRLRARNEVRARKHTFEAEQVSRGDAEGAAAEVKAMNRLATHFVADARRADIITNVPVEGGEGAPLDGHSVAELRARPLWSTLRTLEERTAAEEEELRRTAAAAAPSASSTAAAAAGALRLQLDATAASQQQQLAASLTASPGRAVDAGPLRPLDVPSSPPARTGPAPRRAPPRPFSLLCSALTAGRGDRWRGRRGGSPPTTRCPRHLPPPPRRGRRRRRAPSPRPAPPAPHRRAGPSRGPGRRPGGVGGRGRGGGRGGARGCGGPRGAAEGMLPMGHSASVPAFGRRAGGPAEGASGGGGAAGGRGSGVARTTVNVEPYVSMPSGHLLGAESGKKLYARALLDNYAPTPASRAPPATSSRGTRCGTRRPRGPSGSCLRPRPRPRPRRWPRRPRPRRGPEAAHQGAGTPKPASPAPQAAEAPGSRAGSAGSRRRTPVRTGGFQNVDASKL
eukprot:tig00021037_g17464.t1